MKCNECNTTIKKRYKTKHEQSKKHKYFSILVLIYYVTNDIAVE